MKADRFQMAQFETFQDLLHHSLLFVPPFHEVFWGDALHQ